MPATSSPIECCVTKTMKSWGLFSSSTLFFFELSFPPLFFEDFFDPPEAADCSALPRFLSLLLSVDLPSDRRWPLRRSPLESSADRRSDFPGGGVAAVGFGAGPCGLRLRDCLRLLDDEERLELLPSLPSLASRVARLLAGPRTGTRGTNTQPMPSTGLPPMRRSSSNNQGCSPWNSWKESLDSTAAPAFSATWRMKASPRPTAPAGGMTISPALLASSNVLRSEASMRWAKVASTMTVTCRSGSSAWTARTASSS